VSQERITTEIKMPLVPKPIAWLSSFFSCGLLEPIFRSRPAAGRGHAPHCISILYHTLQVP
jgi:hypothetical protein